MLISNTLLITCIRQYSLGMGLAPALVLSSSTGKTKGSMCTKLTLTNSYTVISQMPTIFGSY